LQIDYVLVLYEVMVVGKDYSALRARPSGRCLRQRFLANARIEPWSKLLILPAWEEYGALQIDYVLVLMK
jgi:hypothetical protein